MKYKALTSLIAAFFILAFTSAKNCPLEFAETAFDFGTIVDTADPITHDFVFTNSADEPVAILAVNTGCGCTKPKYTAEPVRPGKSGKVSITFLPAGQRGEINKSIKVRYRSATAKSAKSITLKISGVVVPSE